MEFVGVKAPMHTRGTVTLFSANDHQPASGFRGVCKSPGSLSRSRLSPAPHVLHDPECRLMTKGHAPLYIHTCFGYTGTRRIQ